MGFEGQRESEWDRVRTYKEIQEKSKLSAWDSEQITFVEWEVGEVNGGDQNQDMDLTEQVRKKSF